MQKQDPPMSQPISAQRVRYEHELCFKDLADAQKTQAFIRQSIEGAENVDIVTSEIHGHFWCVRFYTVAFLQAHVSASLYCYSPEYTSFNGEIFLVREWNVHDQHHKVQVWMVEGIEVFIPLHSGRAGRTWNHYASRSGASFYSSYSSAAAVNMIMKNFR